MWPGRWRLRRVGWLACFVLVLTTCTGGDDGVNTTTPRESVPLPEPRPDSEMSLDEVLEARRSVRQYTSQRLTDVEISQLLWAAQGMTRGGRGRTAPSAGGLYPLEVYVVTADGVFHYDPAQHGLSMVAGEDLREPLSRVALGQEAVRDAPAVFGVTAVVARNSIQVRRSCHPLCAPRSRPRRTISAVAGGRPWARRRADRGLRRRRRTTGSRVAAR